MKFIKIWLNSHSKTSIPNLRIYVKDIKLLRISWINYQNEEFISFLKTLTTLKPKYSPKTLKLKSMQLEILLMLLKDSILEVYLMTVHKSLLKYAKISTTKLSFWRTNKRIGKKYTGETTDAGSAIGTLFKNITTWR